MISQLQGYALALAILVATFRLAAMRVATTFGGAGISESAHTIIPIGIEKDFWLRSLGYNPVMGQPSVSHVIRPNGF